MTNEKIRHNAGKWWHYYLPLRWTLATRYINVINVINVISFFIIDAMPSAYLVFVLMDFNWQLLSYWLLAFYTMFCFYECGYIFNEIISVRYEDKPTIRIPEPFFSQIPKHLENLITIRLVLGTLGSWFLLIHFPANKVIYILFVLALLVVYSVHNFFRGKINIVTMSAEVSLKYMIPISIFIPYRDLFMAFSAIFLTIVLVRAIEYIAKKKFISAVKVTQNVDVFRIKYYIRVCLMSLIFCYTDFWPIALFGLPLIFLFYRIFAKFAISNISTVSNVIHKSRQYHGTEDNKEK